MDQTKKSQPKLSRGEKCISIHIIVTLLILLVLFIIYVVHLLLVEHNGWDVFRVTRRSSELHENLRTMTKETAVGVAYIKSSPPRAACNTILLKARWSLAPAHCLGIRSEPALAALLPHWRIRYKNNGQIKETDIKRSIFHSYYNKDDFDNNIGLFQHMDRINMPEFVFPEVSDTLKGSTEELAILGWSTLDQTKRTPVRVLNHARCSQFVTPIVDSPREAELCVYQTQEGSSIEGVHGGALWFKGLIVGFHTWGDRSGKLPQVALLLEPYRTWIEDNIHMNP